MTSFRGWFRISAVALTCCMPVLQPVASSAETKPAAAAKQAEKKQKAGDAKPDQQEILTKRARTQMNSGKVKEMFAAVELTPEQREQLIPGIADLYKDRWAYLDEHRKQINAAREAIKQAETSDDQEAIAEARKAYFKVFNGGPQVNLDEVAETVRPTLDNEQSARLDAFLKENAKAKKKPANNQAKPKKPQEQPAEPGE